MPCAFLTKIKYLMKLSIMNVTNSSMGFTQPKPPELRWSSLLKHLSCREKSKQYYVFVLPIAEEVDLKVAAKTVGEKSVEMIHVKDITAITGYVRGGCTPLGMKKQFPTVLHDSARNFDKIYISGGRIGTSITVNPDALLSVVRGQYADIIMH